MPSKRAEIRQRIGRLLSGKEKDGRSASPGDHTQASLDPPSSESEKGIANAFKSLQLLSPTRETHSMPLD